jgi:hypothetical protein
MTGVAFLMPRAGETGGETVKSKDIGWHCLGPTFASRLVKAGEEIRTVGSFLAYKV